MMMPPPPVPTYPTAVAPSAFAAQSSPPYLTMPSNASVYGAKAAATSYAPSSSMSVGTATPATARAASPIRRTPLLLLSAQESVSQSMAQQQQQYTPFGPLGNLLQNLEASHPLATHLNSVAKKIYHAIKKQVMVAEMENEREKLARAMTNHDDNENDDDNDNDKEGDSTVVADTQMMKEEVKEEQQQQPNVDGVTIQTCSGDHLSTSTPTQDDDDDEHEHDPDQDPETDDETSSTDRVALLVATAKKVAASMESESENDTRKKKKKKRGAPTPARTPTFTSPFTAVQVEVFESIRSLQVIGSFTFFLSPDLTNQSEYAKSKYAEAIAMYSSFLRCLANQGEVTITERSSIMSEINKFKKLRDMICSTSTSMSGSLPTTNNHPVTVTLKHEQSVRQVLRQRLRAIEDAFEPLFLPEVEHTAVETLVAKSQMRMQMQNQNQNQTQTQTQTQNSNQATSKRTHADAVNKEHSANRDPVTPSTPLAAPVRPQTQAPVMHAHHSGTKRKSPSSSDAMMSPVSPAAPLHHVLTVAAPVPVPTSSSVSAPTTPAGPTAATSASASASASSSTPSTIIDISRSYTMRRELRRQQNKRLRMMGLPMMPAHHEFDDELESDDASNGGVTPGGPPAGSHSPGSSSTASSSQPYVLSLSSIPSRKRRGTLDQSSIDVLRAWLFEHFAHPYPSEEEKRQLGKLAKLKPTQVNYWFINARVRIWRPLLESIYARSKEQQQTGCVASLAPMTDGDGDTDGTGKSEPSATAALVGVSSSEEAAAKNALALASVAKAMEQAETVGNGSVISSSSNGSAGEMVDGATVIPAPMDLAAALCAADVGVGVGVGATCTSAPEHQAPVSVV